MSSDCYVCGEPAEGECLVCGKAFCRSHGNRLCAQCSEQDEIERRAEAYEGLPSPLFFRGALAIALLAVVLEIGWDAYKSVSGSPAQVYAPPTYVSVMQTPSPKTTPQPQVTAQPGAQTTPQPNVQASPQPTAVPPKPTPEPPTPTPTGGNKYTVQPGDTLIEIALKFGVTWQAIQQANDVDPTRMRTGQVLTIPPKQ